ncbi:MAG TPA: ABC transporter permease [Synergistales bacterium]|nr:ABC transporter permease [Synergistales bacterium]HRV70889.1 ABC transporter permease [Thermovirgaceae bacterium]
MTSHPRRESIILPVLLATGYTAMLLAEPFWEKILRMLFPSRAQVVYERSSMITLAWEHLVLVLVSSLLATILGVIIGILITRKSGRDFIPVVDDITSIGQTFPPVAVLALAVPSLGFGFQPALFALFIYGLMPVLRNTVTGLESVSPDILDAAAGMGMKPVQSLLKVELPLAVPVIMGGIRTSAVISVGTATIGATIGAGGLGAPIISGLISQNPAIVLQGAISAAFFAVVLDSILKKIESMLSGPRDAL